MLSPKEVFAKTIISLEPYLADIVLIGGWVHALYLANAEAGAHERYTAVYTYDIDFSIPRHLPKAGREDLLELAGKAGFEVDPVSHLGGASIRLTQGTGNLIVDLDLITTSEVTEDAVVIDGQASLLAPAYPGQTLLQENWKWLIAGPEIHASLNPARKVRVPTPAAYVVHKAGSSLRRPQPEKATKDLVYLYEVLRHPVLGPEAMEGLRTIAAQYRPEYDQWRDRISQVVESKQERLRMAEQLALAGGNFGSEEEISQGIAARVRRVLAEAPQ